MKSVKQAAFAACTVLALSGFGASGALAQSGHGEHAQMSPGHDGDSDHGAMPSGSSAHGQDGMMMVHGSPTVARTVLFPHKAHLDQAAGRNIHVVANGSSTGIMDLVSGKAELAMISAPLEEVRASIERRSPGMLGDTQFTEHRIGSIKIQFIVHPDNPVRSISRQQMREILTGKIVNWRELGGENLPIIVFTTPAGKGARNLIENEFPGGEPITGKARKLTALSQVTKVISQARPGIGFGNQTSIDASVAVVPGLEIEQPLVLVTKGNPNADVRALIAAMSKMHGQM